MGSTVLRRVLVLEPHPSVVEDYRITLCRTGPGMGPAEDEKGSRDQDAPGFDLVFAGEDSEALGKVCLAVEENRPFSVAFIDPGQETDEDKLKFLSKLRAADPGLPIVVVSAGWHPDPLAASRRVPPAESLYFLQKPFHGREVQQLALALSERPSQRGEAGNADFTGQEASAKLLATSLAGVLVFDPLDRLQASNGAMRSLFPELADCLQIGTSFEALQRQIASRLLPTDTLFRTEAWVRERLKRHGAGGGLFEQRLRGDRWVMIGECVLENGETHCHYYDITELKRRQVSEAAAARLNQVGQSLGAFFDRLEAEARAREADKSGPSDTVVPLSLARAKAAGREVPDRPQVLVDSELVNKVRAAAQRQSLNPEASDLNAALGGHLGGLAALIPREIELEVIKGAGLWPVLIDQQKLLPVLRELILNACEAMEKGGRLTVETANRRLDRGYAASRSGLSAGDYVCLSVRDSGAGMARELADRAFNPFFTSKGEAYLGLGLSVVHGFVSQSGGYVEIVRGADGGGTGVEILLRRLRAGSKAEKQALGAKS